MSESDRYCGALGCRSSASLIIDHPDHGRRTVCPDHAVGYDVVERLGGEAA